MLLISRMICRNKISSISRLKCAFIYESVRFSSISSTSRKKGLKKSSSTSKKYSDTLNLPKLTFPLGKNINENECAIQKDCKFEDLYEWQRHDETRQEDFILHDGPPYANGRAHVGHALNKIVKDITNRYKLLRGDRIHYRPGWDCHGLPIELKALQADSSGEQAYQRDPIYIRTQARNFARNAIKDQMTSFRRWGVMADWTNPYYTYDKSYQVQQLKAFWEMYQKGLIYRDYMPVYWSPSSRTAVAEAELEYNSEHVSPAIYLKFELTNLGEMTRLQNLVTSEDKVYALVWTTTPWTIPANKAICYSSQHRYSLVRCVESDIKYVIASDLLEAVQADTGAQFSVLDQFQGSELQGSTYRHPLMTSSRALPLLAGDHVTMDKGTGLVHTAPAHGHDDYQVALKHNLNLDCLVNELGCFTDEAGPMLAGKSVLSEGNEEVIKMLGDAVYVRRTYTHSYPYDWRTKKPVLIRASKQWFIDTQSLTEQALECMKSVKVTPESLRGLMTSLLTSRRRWCISRQRVWGLPIPVFYHPLTDQPVVNTHVLNHVMSLVDMYGSDCWWSMNIDELLPPHIKEKAGLDVNVDYIRGNDIFDIWLDSGISWKCVLPEEDEHHHQQADVYIEGVDQFRGWFQAALITSLALTGRPPYKHLLVHGFAVDESGKKMSKSVGNVIHPHVIVNGGKFQGKPLPGYGADVLRWWAGRYYLQTKVLIGRSILDDAQQQIINIRKCIRFLLGNLSDLGEGELVESSRLLPQDAYMLHLINNFSNTVTTAYEEYDYTKVLIHLEKFINSQVSSFYFSNIKDRLYCDSSDGHGRRSCQTILRHLYDVITMTSAPVLPHLVEECNIHRNYEKQHNDSIFKTRWPKDLFSGDVIDDVTKHSIEALLTIKESFNSVIEAKDPLLYDVTITGSDNLCQQFQSLEADSEPYSALTELIRSSHCRVLNSNQKPVFDQSLEAEDAPIRGTCHLVSKDGVITEEDFSLHIFPSCGARCERCRQYTAPSGREPCDRCLRVLAEAWSW